MIHAVLTPKQIRGKNYLCSRIYIPFFSLTLRTCNISCIVLILYMNTLEHSLEGRGQGRSQAENAIKIEKKKKKKKKTPNTHSHETKENCFACWPDRSTVLKHPSPLSPSLFPPLTIHPNPLHALMPNSPPLCPSLHSAAPYLSLLHPTHPSLPLPSPLFPLPSSPLSVNPPETS